MRGRLPELFFAVPGDLRARTGGYEYDRRLLALLPAAGWQPHLLAWPDGFPLPGAAARQAAAASLAERPDGACVLIDGLAFGALPDLAARESQRLRLVALVHHPLALESGLSEEQRRHLRESERRALGHAHGVLATSATTAEHLIAEYGVPRARIRVARPGTDRRAPVPKRAKPGGPRLLSVGAIIPRKGYDVLVAALTLPPAAGWHATIIGSLARDRACVADLCHRIAAAGLQDRIDLRGEVEDIAPAYDAADLLVLASRHEGYGMVLAEALQHGLPIIATRAGAIPELVPEDAGLLVPPDDAPALAEALQTMRDETMRARFAAGAARAAHALPRWEETARSVAEALRAFAA
jgi:glycosyltransferase involved in cell wall biosynthesis